MKRVPKNKAIFSFSSKHKPVEYVEVGEKVLLETEDAFGGQMKGEVASIEKLDWSKVNAATGPIFIDNAEPGDTLLVNVEAINTAEKGAIAVIPRQGVLKHRTFRAMVETVPIKGEYVYFGETVRLKANPMVGTIGVAPFTGEVPTGSLGRHGGNMDVKEVTAGTRLFLPVFVEGALFAAGDLHAVQEDGEVCVSAVEVSGEILVSFDILKERNLGWPVLETEVSYAFLTCGDTLDEASEFAVEAAVEALMREHNWSFEKAYMFASLAVDLRINQVVDPKKGVRAVISKRLMSAGSLFLEKR